MKPDIFKLLYGPIARWAAVASLPFAPEIVLPTIRNMIQVGVGPTGCPYGLAASFNPTFPGPSGTLGCVSPWEPWSQSGGDGTYCGELSLRTYLALDASVPAPDDGTAAGRIRGELA